MSDDKGKLSIVPTVTATVDVTFDVDVVDNIEVLPVGEYRHVSTILDVYKTVGREKIAKVHMKFRRDEP